MTLEINKGIICDLLQCKSSSQPGVEGAVLKKMMDESQYLKTRLEDTAKQIESLNA